MSNQQKQCIGVVTDIKIPRMRLTIRESDANGKLLMDTTDWDAFNERRSEMSAPHNGRFMDYFCIQKISEVQYQALKVYYLFRRIGNMLYKGSPYRQFYLTIPQVS